VLGVVLALAVVAIGASLVGLIWVGIPLGVVAIVLFLVFVLGLGRRPARDRAQRP
jgi:FtsH-binding integral membrane protein